MSSLLRNSTLETVFRPFPGKEGKNVRSEKLQNESSPKFSNFCPEFCQEFCSEFSPNFSRSFRASFRGKRRQEKIHQKSPPFFNAKFPGRYEKKIHYLFWRAGKVKKRSQKKRNSWQGEKKLGKEDQGSTAFGKPWHAFACVTLASRKKFLYLGCRKRGCNKWGFKGCLAALPGNRLKSAFFALFLPFSPFSGGPEEHLENPENGGKRPFSSDILRFP